MPAAVLSRWWPEMRATLTLPARPQTRPRRYPLTALVIVLLAWLHLQIGNALPAATQWALLSRAPADFTELQFAFATLPRLAMALLVGAALGFSGSLLQQLTQNRLVSPMTLGASAGAWLGLVCATLWLPELAANHGEWPALAGAMLALLLVLLIAGPHGIGGLPLVLGGMALNLLLGALASAFEFELIGPVGKTVGLLADAASPVALFTIGAVLARSQIQVRESGHPPILLRDYLPIAVTKLVVHPVLVLLVLLTAQQWGLALERFTIVSVVLVAALPSASNVALLTERFGADTGRIARIILVTTAAAFLTFSGAVALLHG